MRVLVAGPYSVLERAALHGTPPPAGFAWIGSARRDIDASATTVVAAGPCAFPRGQRHLRTQPR